MGNGTATFCGVTQEFIEDAPCDLVAMVASFDILFMDRSREDRNMFEVKMMH